MAAVSLELFCQPITLGHGHNPFTSSVMLVTSAAGLGVTEEART
jgi:hypothetical protein